MPNADTTPRSPGLEEEIRSLPASARYGEDKAELVGLLDRAADEIARLTALLGAAPAEREGREHGALENCRLLAMRMVHRLERRGEDATDWRHILRFCAEGGVEGAILRRDALAAAPREQPEPDAVCANCHTPKRGHLASRGFDRLHCIGKNTWFEPKEPPNALDRAEWDAFDPDAPLPEPMSPREFRARLAKVRAERLIAEALGGMVEADAADRAAVADMVRQQCRPALPASELPITNPKGGVLHMTPEPPAPGETRCHCRHGDPYPNPHCPMHESAAPTSEAARLAHGLEEIDDELAALEDIAHGDIGDRITQLRGKITTLAAKLDPQTIAAARLLRGER